MNILFKNIRIFGREASADIYIKDGILAEVPSAVRCKEVKGEKLMILPSFTDLHVHLREPGGEHKETVRTGTLAARNGGFSAVFCMPNTMPVCDTPQTVKYILERPRSTDVFPVSAITKGLEGKELTDFLEMKEAGAAAFSDDGQPVYDGELLRTALKEAKRLGMMLTAHCENKAFISDRRNIPPEAEYTAVKYTVQAAVDTDAPVHIAHVSTKESLNIIREAKAAGIPVTAETCPHYFTLTKAAVKDKSTLAMMNPPLSEEADVYAVKEAIADGTIDVISTDHAPHSAEEKALSPEKTPFGITGLETSFALSYTNLVKTGIITLERLVYMMSEKPRLIGKIAAEDFLVPSKRPTFVVVDLGKDFVFDAARSLSMSKNTPFGGCIMTGGIKYNILRGDIFECQPIHL